MKASVILSRSLTKRAASYGYGRSPFAPTGMKMDFGGKPGIRESIDMKNLQQQQQKATQELQKMQQERDTLKMKLEASKLQPAPGANAEPKFPATPLGSFVSGRINGLTGRLGKLKLGMPKFAHLVEIERICDMEKSADWVDSTSTYLRDAANHPGGAYQSMIGDTANSLAAKTPWALKWAPKSVGWLGKNTVGRLGDGAAWVGRNVLKGVVNGGDAVGTGISQIADADNRQRFGKGLSTAWSGLWDTDSASAKAKLRSARDQISSSNIVQGAGNIGGGLVDGATSIASVSPWGWGAKAVGAGRFALGQGLNALNGMGGGGGAPALAPSTTPQVTPQPTTGPGGSDLGQMAMLLGSLFGGRGNPSYAAAPVGAATSSMMQSPETYARRA